MAHNFVDGGAQTNGRVAHRLTVAPFAHGVQVFGRQEHLEQLLERVAAHEGVEAAFVETQRRKGLGQMRQNFSTGRGLQNEAYLKRFETSTIETHVFDQQDVHDDVSDTFVLQGC